MKIAFDGFSLTGKQVYAAFIQSGNERSSLSRWEFTESSHFALLLLTRGKAASEIIKGTKATPLVRHGNAWERLDVSEACSVILQPLLPEKSYSEVEVRVGDGVLLHENIVFSIEHGGEELHYFLEAFRRNLLQHIGENKNLER